MRVLLASKHCHTGKTEVGGVQSWQKTVSAQLRQMGHAAHFWEHGMPAPAGRFDFGILANWGRTSSLAKLCRKVVVVSHGIIDEEQPPADVPLAFTSEGVKRHWGGVGPVIRQPIDLAFWSPHGVRKKVVVRYSYRHGLDFLRAVSRSLGMGYDHVRRVNQLVARDRMRAAGCVVATGRAALEAMACGVPVVIADHRSAYQGPLLSFSPAAQMFENYSGRGGCEADAPSMRSAIEQAMRRGSMRAHVEEHHDAKKITEALLCFSS